MIKTDRYFNGFHIVEVFISGNREWMSAPIGDGDDAEARLSVMLKMKYGSKYETLPG